MESLELPRCELCYAGATSTKPLRKCARCGIFFYCGRDHQKRDWKHHKQFCDHAANVLANLASEEAKLRSAGAYEGAVGRFWLLPETKTLMGIKFLVIRTFGELLTHESIQLTLNQAMDCLRLCRPDIFRMREAVPTFMLQLGRLQECYDLIKWYATPNDEGEYDWCTPGKPFLSIRNADVTEPIDLFKNTQSPFVLSALTYIKMTLANKLEEAVTARVKTKLTSRPTPNDGMLSNLLKSTDGGAIHERSSQDLVKLQLKTAQQAIQAFRLTHECNPHFWKAMLNPASYRDLDSSCECTGPDCKYNATGWLTNTSALWAAWHDFIEAMNAMV